MNNSRTKYVFPLLPTRIFLLCTLFIALAGGLLFEKIKENEKNDTNQTLISVGHLKTSQIQSYLAERKSDAAVVSSYLSNLSEQYWLTQKGGSAPTDLKHLIESVVGAYKYRGLLLLDANADTRLNSSRSGTLTETGKAIALHAMREHAPATFQIYFGDPTTPDVPVLDTFVPVMNPDGTSAVGIVVLRAELNYLYQLLQDWPIKSGSAESLLVTRDGDNVLFLNELVFQKGAAAKLRIPLSADSSSPAWPAISALNGRYGLIEANDYRNERVLAYAIAVRDTPWSMVVKMDLKEAVSHSQRLLQVTKAIALAFVAFAGIAVWFWWRKDQTERLANQQLQESETRYRSLHESMMDAYLKVDMSGRLLEFNHAFQKMLGYPPEELSHMAYGNLMSANWRGGEAHYITEQVILYGQSPVHEMEFIRKNGTVFPVEIKSFLLRNEANQPEAIWSIVRDITERKQAEDTLHFHSEILRNLLEGIALIRATDGTIVYANLQFERMFRYGPGELLGAHVSTINAAGEKSQGEVASTIIAELERTGRWSGEVRNIRKDGTDLWCHANVSTFDHPQFGQVWVAVHEDITGRKRAEEEFQRFFNLSPDLACIASTNGYFLKINTAWQALLGYTEQELISSPFMNFVHPEDAEATTREVGRLRNGSTTFDFTNRYRCKDGSYRWLEWKATSAVDNTVIYATARDVTERLQTEEQLRKSAHEVADLYNHAPCGYHSLDKDGNIRLMNDTELSWLGYTRDELLGKFKWQDLLAPASRMTFKKAYMQFIHQGYIRDHEAEIVRKDGTTFIGLINASAIYDRNGNYVMSRSTVIDITERKKAKSQLQELSAHLQTVREEEKYNIAREIHDDLGGTLTALKIEAFRLEGDLSTNKAAAPLLKRVRSMSKLLDGAVNVTRRVITELRPTILDDLGLLAAIEWQAAQFQKHTGVKCRVNCVEDMARLSKRHSIALFRIFQETLTNVARHSGATRVEVEFHSNNEEVMLTISDNGHGIPKEHVVASTSFGLRGMRERIEQLGGKITFESPPKGGFVVAASLPLNADSQIEERI